MNDVANACASGIDGPVASNVQRAGYPLISGPLDGGHAAPNPAGVFMTGLYRACLCRTLV